MPMPMSAPVAGAPGPTAVAAPGAVRALVPSWSRRGIALAIDTVAVYGVPALISMGVTGTTTVAPAGLVVSVVLLLIDLVIVQGIAGQSLGKWAAAIAVVDPASRQPVGIVRAAVRTVVSIFTIVVFLIVVLYDFQRLTTRGTRLCDSAARTVVVPAAERQPRSP